MSDYFPSMSMKPNPQCDSGHCRQRQAEYQAHLASLPPQEEKKEEEQETVVHESNEWGMSDALHCFMYMKPPQKCRILIYHQHSYFCMLEYCLEFIYARVTHHTRLVLITHK